MKADDLKTKTADELSKMLLDLKKQQFNLRFRLSQGQVSQTAEIRAVRRDIARVRTFMNARRGAEGGAAPQKAKKQAAPKADKAGAKAGKSVKKSAQA